MVQKYEQHLQETQKYILRTHKQSLCLTKILRPAFTYANACRKIPLEFHLISCANKEIYCIFKIWCIICFISHAMLLISQVKVQVLPITGHEGPEGE